MQGRICLPASKCHIWNVIWTSTIPVKIFKHSKTTEIASTSELAPDYYRPYKYPVPVDNRDPGYKLMEVMVELHFSWTYCDQGYVRTINLTPALIMLHASHGAIHGFAWFREDCDQGSND